MTTPEIPSSGFWHCVISGGRGSFYGRAFDYTFDRIVKEVAIPYRKNKEFYIDGARVSSRDKIASIKIIYTEKSSKSYGIQSTFAGNYYNCIDNGIDYTHEMLQGEFCNVEFVEIENQESDLTPSIFVSANNTNTNININTINLDCFHKIEEIRDVFDEIRHMIKDHIAQHDFDSMVEIQEALDMVNSETDKERAVSAMTKVGRFIRKSFDKATSLGSAMEKFEKVIVLLRQLKNLYNISAQLFSLPQLP